MKKNILVSIIVLIVGVLLTLGTQYEVVLIKKAHAFDIAYANYLKQSQQSPAATTVPDQAK